MFSRLWPICWFASLLAQVPATDARLGDLPHTDTHFVLPAYRNLAAWQARSAELSRQILSAAGLSPMLPRTPLRPRVLHRIERDAYAIETVLLETMPGYFLGGNVYVPRRQQQTGARYPGVITPHGHWTYGRLEHQASFSGPTLGINLARQGYVAFAYDMVGYNDTLQTPHIFGTTPAEQLWSFGPLGLQLWNSIRALDYLESRPDVDAARLAATGASGGGTQTFLVAAVDPRVRFAAPVNMVSALMQGGCPCENQPGLRIGTFNVEIAAMMAPRPLLLVSATGDWTRNVPREEFPAIRNIYDLYGQQAHVEAVQFQADHNYNQDSREAVYRFFGKHILGETEAAKLVERNARIEPLRDMLGLLGRPLPEGALTYEGVFEQWKRLTRQAAAGRSSAERRAELMRVLAVEWPGHVERQHSGERIVLSRAGRQDRVTGLWLEGRGTPALVVHPSGSVAARHHARVRQLRDAGRPVLLLDAFPGRQSSHRFLHTFNPSDDACRVQDILTGLAFLQGKAELIGLEKAAVWALFAAAVAPGATKVTAEIGSFQGTDDDFARDFFVPGIQRAGGLEAARALLRAAFNDGRTSGGSGVHHAVARQTGARLRADLRTLPAAGQPAAHRRGVLPVIRPTASSARPPYRPPG